MAIEEPTLIPRPWASAPNGRYEEIPDTTEDFGRASWSLGFPVDTATPLKAGGIPPNWLDVQGVLNALSQHIVFGQSGGRYAWANDRDFPAGACIIGINGVVYQALQDSGPGTSAGAKNPTSVGNSAYWGALATPDGTTIVLDANGQLAVSPANIASLLADGVTITVQNGKLVATGQTGDASALADGTTIVANNNNKLSVGAPATAALLADGTTIVANNGKLSAIGGGGGGGDAASLVDNVTTVADNGKIKVDLSSATTSALSGISQYLAKSGGGLAMDSGTGKLIVNLDHLIPLYTDFDLYVDGSTGSDTIEEGRGTQAMPFATIQACVDYFTSHYALVGRITGSLGNDVIIHVAPGTYHEKVYLQDYCTVGGYVFIQKDSNAVGDVAIDSIYCAGGSWHLYRLNIGMQFPLATIASGYGVAAIGSTANLYLLLCNVSVSTSGTTSNDSLVCSFFATGRAIITTSPSSGSTTIQCTKGSADRAYLYYADGGASIYISDTTNSGTVTANVCAKNRSYVYGSATHSISGTVTGKKYVIETGSAIYGPAGGFPGSQVGSVDSATYCWYKEYGS